MLPASPRRSFCQTEATEEIRDIVQRPRSRRTPLAARTIVLALAVTARPAAAQTVFQADGTANLGYEQTTGAEAHSRAYGEIRPALAIQTGSPGLAWRAAYLFAGNLTLAGSGPISYSNTLDLSLAAEPTRRSTVVVAASVSQGSTVFQLSQRAANAGQPAFRAPGNPALVTSSLQETFGWETTQSLRLRQSLIAAASAPQDDLTQYNATAIGSLGLDRVYQNNAVGAEVRSSVSLLRPLAADRAPYRSISNALLGNWNHDFDAQWNGQVTAGVEQVLTFAGSYPLAVVPTGTITARYLSGATAGSLAFSSGATADVQTGTVALADSVVARALVTFDPVLARYLGASAGFMHARPLGQTAVRAAAGTGNAVQGDVGLFWGLSETALAFVRYSLAYQFQQPGGLQPSLAHVFMVGITARYSNARYNIPMPTLGNRVDGRDATPFPEGGERRP